jgi:hypothetical protein
MEQPPSSLDAATRAYLLREINRLESLISRALVLPPNTAMPIKPLVGKLYYFPNTIAPTITTAGVWVYKSTGWSYLG